MPEITPFSRHRNARNLDAYWDDVIDAAPIDPIRPREVERADALAVRHAQALATVPAPDPAFADRLLANLLETIPEPGQRQAGNVQAARAPVAVPAPVPGSVYLAPRPLRRNPIVNIAAVLLLLLAVGGIWYETGHRLPNGDSGPTELAQFDFDAVDTRLEWQTGVAAGFSPSICDVAVSDDGHTYVVDCLENNIKVFDTNGMLVEEWGSYGLEPGQFRFGTPNQNLGGIDLDAEGNIYVFDSGNDRIQKFSPDHWFITEWGTKGTGIGEFRAPLGTVDRATDRVYVADTSNGRIQVFNLEGEYLDQWGEPGDLNGQFRKPIAIAIGPDGSVYVADWEASRIQRFNPAGVYLGDVGIPGQLGAVTGLAVYPDGYVIAATGQRHLLLFTPDGALLGNIPAIEGAGELTGPRALALDSAGKLYMLESSGPFEYLPGVPGDEDTAPSRVVKLDLPDLGVP